jgi:uncharacterized lipoprotein YajG
MIKESLMKRLFFAVAILGLMACAKKEEAAPAAEPAAAAPAAAPATDTTQMAAPADTTKHE